MGEGGNPARVGVERISRLGRYSTSISTSLQCPLPGRRLNRRGRGHVPAGASAAVSLVTRLFSLGVPG